MAADCSTQPHLRSVDDVQTAHDVLLAVLKGEVEGVYAPPVLQEHMKTALDVLCWCLQHESNTTFGANLRMVMEAVTKTGVFAHRDEAYLN